jgi:hypothetical protein
MTASNTYGNSVVEVFKNNSGGTLVLGDVAIVDTTSDESVTTTTVASTTAKQAVALETIPTGQSGRFVTSGYVSLVNVNASVTRGHYGSTYSVAKQATDVGSARTAGTFCQFLKGGTTPSAILFSGDLSAGSLTDHTHAASGSGSNGGGSTLTPGTLNVPVATPATTEGQAGWDGTLRSIDVYDSVRARPTTPAGFTVVAYPPAFPTMDAFTSSTTLAAVSSSLAGAAVAPILLTAPMFLKAFRLRSNDTSLLRTAEARLYVSRLDNSATCNFVAGTDTTWSFTPGAASGQTSADVSGAPVLLPPGLYFLVVRNTSSSNTFALATSVGTPTMGLTGSKNITSASVAALGTTIDLVTSWVGTSAFVGLALMGYKPDHSAAW